MRECEHLNKGGIYKIYSIATGDLYIGSTLNIRKRRSEHLCTLKNGTHFSCLLTGHVAKYGVEDLVFDIIEELSNKSRKEMLVIENEWIDKLKPAFNLEQSDLNKRKSPEYREAKRQSALGNKNNLGKKRTKASREKMRQSAIIGWAKRGEVKYSEETKAKMAAARTRWWDKKRMEAFI